MHHRPGPTCFFERSELCPAKRQQRKSSQIDSLLRYYLNPAMKFTLLLPFATLAISSAESSIRGSASIDSIDIEPSTIVYAAPVRSYGGQSAEDLWNEIAVSWQQS